MKVDSPHIQMVDSSIRFQLVGPMVDHLGVFKSATMDDLVKDVKVRLTEFEQSNLGSLTESIRQSLLFVDKWTGSSLKLKNLQQSLLYLVKTYVLVQTL